MKLRRCNSAAGIEVQALIDERWLGLSGLKQKDSLANDHGVDGDIACDLLAVLQLGPEGWRALEESLRAAAPAPSASDQALVPLAPTSFRDFMLFEQHVIDASRGYVRRFIPRVYPWLRAVERVIRRPLPPFRPAALWYQQPIYYFGNHLNVVTSGAPVHWPSYTRALDYELELGAILARPLFDADPVTCAAAIGGFVVLNDVSARDIQRAEMASGFGPQKAKHFLTALSPIVVTADEVLPVIDKLTGFVQINGDTVAHCSTSGMQFSLPEAIAFASRGEQLHPGELFGTGTLPGGSGMENGHWLKPGDTLSLTIESIGEVSNVISAPTGAAT